MSTRVDYPFGAADPTTGWRRALWIALLVAASVALSLGFSCACPFAAFGAATAITLKRRDALLLAVGVWLANQAVGFGLLRYPWDGSTLAWGAVLGIVAILATLAAQGAARIMAVRGGLAVAAAAFILAFMVYEGGLYLVAAAALGGTEDFAAGIVAQIVEINAASFVGLLVLSQLGALIGLVAKPLRGFPATAGRA